MIRHSIIRQAVVALAVLLLCIPLQSSSQHVNKIMQQKIRCPPRNLLHFLQARQSCVALYPTYEQHAWHVLLREDGKRPALPSSGRTSATSKACWLPGKTTTSSAKPDLPQRHCLYNIVCRPHEWVLNNKVYFRFREENIISGHMVVTNDFDAPPFSFSGMPSRSLSTSRPALMRVSRN